MEHGEPRNAQIGSGNTEGAVARVSTVMFAPIRVQSLSLDPLVALDCAGPRTFSALGIGPEWVTGRQRDTGMKLRVVIPRGQYAMICGRRDYVDARQQATYLQCHGDSHSLSFAPSRWIGYLTRGNPATLIRLCSSLSSRVVVSF